MASAQGPARTLQSLFCHPARGARDPLADLTADYQDEVRMAAQLRSHAERAPYPQAAASLRSLAALEDRHAAWLRAEIEGRGGRVEPRVAELAGGRSHWERLRHDLHFADAKRRRYLEQAIRWDPERPELADLVQRIEAEEASSRVALEDLLARSDPQAIN